MSDKKLLSLDSLPDAIPGIGPKKSLAMANAGIFSAFDLLRQTPTLYQNRKNILPLSFLRPSPELQGMFKAKLDSIKMFHVRRGLAIINATFSDASATVAARWFNKKYLIKQLKEGNEYWLFGTATSAKNQLTLSNPDIEPFRPDSSNKTQQFLTPIYASNVRLSEARISPAGLRKLIDKILDLIDWKKSFPQNSDEQMFSVIQQAIINTHRPKTEDEAMQAQKTMAFFDQLLFQIGVLKRREALTGVLSLPEEKSDSEFVPDYSLPFELTLAQKQVLGQITDDLRSEEKHIMNRLLQGDVGSGKTMVAFIAMRFFIENCANQASQCAFMAPTEILAWQHFNGFCKFFPGLESEAVILTGSHKIAERRIIEEKILSGTAKYIFGTHALFQEKMEFSHLGFCVIDEQQRFGVNHRRTLYRKGQAPHQLLLSATPIPRTLSLTIFGDMDTSVINELPPGREPVKTVLTESFMAALPLIRETIDKKEQVYMVCPLIEISDKSDWVSVEEAADRISDLLPEINFACMSSQQTWDEKDQIMQAFKSGQLDMIIATTVIEVGVDSPTATLIVIENADRFGLSQLHQLRGRVGRGSAASTCVLVSDNAESSQRLKLLESISDGFVLSLEDLKLRGPGDLLGTRQSGLSHPCFSHRISQKLIENARKRAFEILTESESSTRDWFLAQMIRSFQDSYKTFMEGG